MGLKQGATCLVQARGRGEEGLAGWVGWRDGPMQGSQFIDGGGVGVSGLSGWLAGAVTRSWRGREGLAWVAWWGEKRERRETLQT